MLNPLLKFGATSSVLLHAATLAPATAAPTTEKPHPGLTVSITAGGRSDVLVWPDVALHVPAGQPASPFVPPGPFTATWEGRVQAELRGNFTFQAELHGALKLEINGQTVLDAIGTNTTGGTKTPMSKPIQLNKGANALKATFTSATTGDSFVRLGWAEKGTNAYPIPKALLTHAVTPRSAQPAHLATGRELFLEHRCIQCHVPADAKRPDGRVPELDMDAPRLDGLGARRHYDWVIRWILDPKSVRPSARMPKLLHGPTASEDAVAIAAYLASLQEEGPKPVPASYQSRQIPPDNGEAAVSVADPRPLYERLHCAACHNPPDAKEMDPGKLSQKGVGTKFPKGHLAEYLLAPEAAYAWTRMPNFHLSAPEAQELEEYLLGASDPPKAQPAPTDPVLIEKGRSLVLSIGCLNCHALKLENLLKAPALDALASRHRKDRDKPPAGDCLGANPFADFAFSAEQKAALDQLTLGGFDSLHRHVPAEFATRQTRLLNCTACHGQIELVPPLDDLGGKLNPEWSARFMAGEIPHKVRFDNHPKGGSWVEARMPAFKTRATDLARGLAALQGFPPVSPPEAPVDLAAAEIGRKLVGKDGGFSCVNCHAIGASLALEVFESEGVNLATSADRLWPSYYRRWFRNPLSIDPQTKMPMYFDEEGASPLTDVLGGNGDAQIEAVWNYLRLRDKMSPPRTD